MINPFVEVIGLRELEEQEKWEEAAALLYSQWKAQKNDCDILCTAAFECWFTLEECDCTSSSTHNLKRILIEMTEYGKEHFGEDSKFLWLFGYMIILFPFWFYEGDDRWYHQWERCGEKMLLKATRLDPDDPLVRMTYLGGKINGKTDRRCRKVREYEELKAAITPTLQERFPGDTRAERYFKEVLRLKPAIGSCD